MDPREVLWQRRAVTRVRALIPLMLIAALASCQSQGGGSDLPGNDNDDRAFSAIGRDETVRFVGTEPFWSGEASGGALTYATPENPDGETIPADRFAGRGGLSISARLGQRNLDLMITEGRCSDGMSDRRFPFTATLRIGEEVRDGCAWTDRLPYVEGQDADAAAGAK